MSRPKPRWAREVLVVLVYVAVVLILTWPGPTKIFSSFSSLDPTYTAWALWWVKKQLFALQNPWHTTFMLAPVGGWLGYHNLTPLAGVLLSPLTATLGAGATTNLTKLITPVIASYVTYRLARRLGIQPWAAVIAGGLYGCSQALMWRADNHFNLAAGAIFPPLALLAADRLRQGRGPSNAVLLGVVLGAAALTDQTYTLYSAALVVLYLLGCAYFEDRDGRLVLLRLAGIGVLVALIVASPQLWAILRQRQAGQFGSDAGLLGKSWVAYGAAPATLLSPTANFESRTGIHLGTWAHHEGEGLSNYGIGLLILAASGALLAFRRRLVKWLIAVWLALTVLALGPTLVLGSDVLTPLPLHSHGVDVSLLMPYSYLVHVPGLSEVRVPARFALLAMLPLALLAGLGLSALAARRRTATTVVLVAGLGLALLELGNPMRFTGPMHFDRLYGPVKTDRTGSIVVDLPLTWGSGLLGSGGSLDASYLSESMPLLRATQHGHPVAYGFDARIGAGQLQQLSSHRFYTDLLRLQGHSVYAVPVPPRIDPRKGAADARRLDVGWVTVWPGTSPRVIPYLRRTGFHRVTSERGALLFGRS